MFDEEKIFAIALEIVLELTLELFLTLVVALVYWQAHARHMPKQQKGTEPMHVPMRDRSWNPSLFAWSGFDLEDAFCFLLLLFLLRVQTRATRTICIVT